MLLFYVLTVWGLFVLRRTMPDAERPYRAFGYPVVPALYVAVRDHVVELLIVKPVYSWPSFILVLTGIPVYFLWPGKRALVTTTSQSDCVTLHSAGQCNSRCAP